MGMVMGMVMGMGVGTGMGMGEAGGIHRLVVQWTHDTIAPGIVLASTTNWPWH